MTPFNTSRTPRERDVGLAVSILVLFPLFVRSFLGFSALRVSLLNSAEGSWMFRGLGVWFRA